MTGETDLPTLLAMLEPELDAATYVFTTFPEYPDLPLEPVAMIQEPEGWTLIVRQDRACEHNLVVTFPCRRITLKVHSSLAAVGMMAAVARALADAGISCNPVAGYHHDHLFVPEKDAEGALMAIRQLSSTAGHHANCVTVPADKQ